MFVGNKCQCTKGCSENSAAVQTGALDGLRTDDCSSFGSLYSKEVDDLRKLVDA
jgi:hypothetical protein